MKARLVLAVLLIAFAGCGGDEEQGESASTSSDAPPTATCEPPELLDFAVEGLEVTNDSCATAGAVTSAATECYFEDFDCPEVEVGGTVWDCAFQVTGPSGSGGRSRAVCFAAGRREVRFEVARAA